MLIYVRIPEHLKSEADQLISHGLYSNLNAMVAVALENLITAEREDGTVETSTPPGPVKSTEAEAAAKEIKSVEKKAESPAIPVTAKAVAIPRAVMPLANSSDISKFVVPLPADLFAPGQRVPVERWVFGQQNRALPAKVNARVFIRLLSELDREMELPEVADKISGVAAHLFVFLGQLDARFGHGKDESLTTGFPEPDSDKALSRYGNHFVAYESTQGALTGMLIQWKLAGVKRGKNKTYLLPTPACVEFAALMNPLLDEPTNGKLPSKFSLEEISWLLNHIAQNVPVEA